MNSIPGVGGTGGSAELLQIVGVVGMRRNVVYHEHRFGAMQLGVHGLAEDLRMCRVNFAFEDALFVELLRLVAEHHDDLAFDVQARVVVVIVFRRGDAEAREHDAARNIAGRGKIQRDEILLEVKPLFFLPFSVAQSFCAGPGARWW